MRQHIRVNGEPLCESIYSFLVLERIDGTIPEGPGDYPMNIFTCVPANEIHAQIMLEFLRRDGMQVKVVNGDCPADEERRYRRNLERMTNAILKTLE